MKRLLPALVLFGAVCMLGLAYYGLGTLSHWLWILAFVILVAAPAFLIVTINPYTQSHSKWWLCLRDPGIVVLSIFVAAGSGFLGEAIGKWELERARNAPSVIIPLLESYHRAQGVYPGTLGEVLSRSEVPRLLVYARTAGGFELGMRDYEGMFPRDWTYDATSNQWVAIDD